MDPLFFAVTIALALGALGGFYTGALTQRRAASHGSPGGPPTEPGGLSLPAERDHVHEFRLNSTEETAGHRVDVYHCARCGAVQRWIVPQQQPAES